MRFRKFAIVLCVLAISGLCLVPATAQEKTEPEVQVPPQNRLYLASLTIMRYNPLGLETQNRLMYSRRLADSTSPLFRDTFFAMGLMTKLNPAYLKVGPLIDFQPIGIFNLRLGYEYLRYFGTMGYRSPTLTRRPIFRTTRERTPRTTPTDGRSSLSRSRPSR